MREENSVLSVNTRGANWSYDKILFVTLCLRRALPLTYIPTQRAGFCIPISNSLSLKIHRTEAMRLSKGIEEIVPPRTYIRTQNAGFCVPISNFLPRTYIRNIQRKIGNENRKFLKRSCRKILE